MEKVNINFEKNVWENLSSVAKKNGYNTRSAFVRKCVDVVIADQSVLTPKFFESESTFDEEYKQMQADNMLNVIAAQEAVDRNMVSSYSILIKIADKLGVDLYD